VNGGEWDRARNVLCVRLDTIGDVLMTTPAIRACKGDGRRVTLLTSRSGAEIARMAPEADDVIAFDAPWVKNAPPLPDSSLLRTMADRLRMRRFDAAVVFTVFSQSALPAAMLCWLADTPLRLAHSRENPYQLLTHWLRDPERDAPSRHEVRRQLDLVASVGWKTDDERLSLRVEPDDVADVTRRLRAAGIDTSRPWVVVHPGATAASRRYPAEMYAAAVRLLARDGLQMVVTGTNDERALAARVVRGCEGAVSLAGALDLRELAALLSLAPLLIANNTGPVHMAAAFGTPVVVVYAMTNMQHTPWMTPSRVLTHDVPCAPCMSSVCVAGHHACLREIAPETVASAARELLAETAGRPAAAVLLDAARTGGR
jgi:lipopolysaccharide heptosyltransferase II